MSRRWPMAIAQVRVTMPISCTSDAMLDRIMDETNREISRWAVELEARLAVLNADLRVEVRL